MSAPVPGVPGDTGLTHLDAQGRAHMVDVSAKAVSVRQATATGAVLVSPAVVAALRSGDVPKGDALGVARVAGIQAAKRTPELVPLAHPVAVHAVSVDLDVLPDRVVVTATVRTADRTGVEMEALTAVTVAALALVDMVKAVDKHTVVTDVRVVAKSGGRSGDWVEAGWSGPSATRPGGLVSGDGQASADGQAGAGGQAGGGGQVGGSGEEVRRG